MSIIFLCIAVKCLNHISVLLEISNLAQNPSSCICVVSICAQLPSGSCLVFSRRKPYWPPGGPPALCLLQGRSRRVGVVVSCSLHRWHLFPATVQCGSGSAHPTGVHAWKRPVWQLARTEIGLLDYTWAVLDGVSQLGRKRVNTKHQGHEKLVNYTGKSRKAPDRNEEVEEY